MTSPLQTLAQRYNLDLNFHDVFGNFVEASDTSLRLVLSAMGIPADTDDDVQRSLAEKDAKDWRAGLDPVVLFRRGRFAMFGVKVRVPYDCRQMPVLWSITLEDGSDGPNGVFYPDQAPEDAWAPESVNPRTVSVWLNLPTDLPVGYHRLKINADWQNEQTRVEAMALVSPELCYLPSPLSEDKRVWGTSAQLYSLRSENNWGIGDFGDLKDLSKWTSDAGASLIGLNPLHALYPHNPHHFSPYSPSSRLFFNTLYVCIEMIPEYAECQEAQDMVSSNEYQSAFKTLREADLIDYPWVSHLKRQVFNKLFDAFKAQHLEKDTPRAKAFNAFCEQQGKRLELLAIYQALHEKLMHEDDSQWGWPVWPERYQHPQAAGIEQFAWENKDRVTYFKYLQWLIDQQLEAAQAEAKQQGQPIGLYLDLAVGADRAGYDLWCDQDLYSFEASLGCPPDLFNQLGQNWGLPPIVPERFTEGEYEPFITMLRQNMRHAGALRFDHALSLFRVYWVPQAATAKDGAYVRYPSEHLLAILAIESHRNKCLVIGEDLGTIPDFVTETLADWKVLSYKVFFFEKGENNSMLPPEAYPHNALVTFSTHDLPTLRGYWEGADIKLREDLELFPNEDARQHELNARPNDKRSIVEALVQQGLVAGEHVDLLVNDPNLPEPVLEGVHRWIARTPCLLQMIQLEDLTLLKDQMNMPGTTNEHPNWRRRLPVSLKALRDLASARQVLDAVKQEPNRQALGDFQPVA